MSDALNEYLALCRDDPFAFGAPRSDCLRYLGGWYKVVRGTDPTEAFRYSTAEEAADLLASLGGHGQAVTSMIGEPIKPGGPPPMRGDIGLFHGAGLVIGVICTGIMWAGKPLRGGTAFLRVTPAIHWSMGFKS